MIDLNEIEAAAKAATPGPWVCSYVQLKAVQTKDGGPIATCDRRSSFTELTANATHIATANPSTVLEMVSTIRHLREQRDELHSALTGLLSYFQSGNSVPVDKATIKADSVEVKAAQLALSKVADKL